MQLQLNACKQAPNRKPQLLMHEILGCCPMLVPLLLCPHPPGPTLCYFVLGLPPSPFTRTPALLSHLFV